MCNVKQILKFTKDQVHFSDGKQGRGSQDWGGEDGL